MIFFFFEGSNCIERKKAEAKNDEDKAPRLAERKIQLGKHRANKELTQPHHNETSSQQRANHTVIP